MLRAPEPVLMLIADISGYTSYLTGTEIDHAQNVLQDLLETIMARLDPPLALVEVEGDACFTYAPAGVVTGQLLLDTIDATYFGFRRRLRDVTQATTCNCNACVLIPKLDLKCIVHAGQAVHQLALGRQTLVGPDVIAVHRLLKNGVADAYGWHAYALLTDAALVSLGLDAAALGMRLRHETYDVGEFDTWVEDLDGRWQQDERRSSAGLEGDRLWASFDVELPASPPIAWEWLTSPRLRPLWQIGTTGVSQETMAGRAGIGTTNHCAHGPTAVTIEHVITWEPFQRYATDGVVPGIGEITFDQELVPDRDGVRLIIRAGGDPARPSRAVFDTVGPIVTEIYERSLLGLGERIRGGATPADPGPPTTEAPPAGMAMLGGAGEH